MKFVRVAAPLLFAAVVCVFVSAPTKYMQSFFDGLTVWAINVLPALFPFAVLSALALKIAPHKKISLSKSLFGVDCDNAWTMSLLCGYPIGARAIADSNADAYTATKACAFCSTAGPIFMLATVGTTLLKNNVATVILLISHLLSSLFNGLLYRSQKPMTLSEQSKELCAADLGNTITDSALAVISVGGLIALFYMLTDMLKSFLPADIADSLPLAFAIGVLEMTNGVFAVCRVADVATATVLCSGLLALGGVCVFCQCYAFLGKKGVKVRDILKMKLTQSAIATLVSFCLVNIFL